MKSTDIPRRLTIPFANSASGTYIRTVPNPSQTGDDASFTDGFPPDTFAFGGAPDGRDVNYMFSIATAWNRWQAAGNAVPYDGTFQAAIGGYPKGAMVTRPSVPGLVYVSAVDDNTDDPTTDTTSTWFRWTPWGRPQTQITDNFTLRLVDGGTQILFPANATKTLTLPPSASAPFQDGVELDILNSSATGVLNIVPDASITLTWAPTGSTGSRALAAKGVAQIYHITTNEWMISGVGLT